MLRTRQSRSSICHLSPGESQGQGHPSKKSQKCPTANLLENNVLPVLGSGPPTCLQLIANQELERRRNIPGSGEQSAHWPEGKGSSLEPSWKTTDLGLRDCFLACVFLNLPTKRSSWPYLKYIDVYTLCKGYVRSRLRKGQPTSVGRAGLPEPGWIYPVPASCSTGWVGGSAAVWLMSCINTQVPTSVVCVCVCVLHQDTNPSSPASKGLVILEPLPHPLLSESGSTFCWELSSLPSTPTYPTPGPLRPGHSARRRASGPDPGAWRRVSKLGEPAPAWECSFLEDILALCLHSRRAAPRQHGCQRRG